MSTIQKDCFQCQYFAVSEVFSKTHKVCFRILFTEVNFSSPRGQQNSSWLLVETQRQFTTTTTVSVRERR